MGDGGLLPTILHVAGAVALLLWAVRLVRTGVERAFMVALRRWLRLGAARPPLAAATGAAVALAMQSATAVGLLAASFASAGTIAAPAALAILLGADVGSALAVQVLMFGAGWAVPVLFVVGVTLFMRARGRTGRQVGRILTGLGLILAALAMIGAATAPLSGSPAVRSALGYLGGDLPTAFLLGALVAWALHSSIAAVLMVATFAAEGALPGPVALALVLGANLGGSLVAFGLTLGTPVEGRRVVMGNLLLRGGGAAAALAAMLAGLVAPGYFAASPHAQALVAHFAFNAAVLVLGLPLARPLMALLARLMPDASAAATPERPSALDPAALADPPQALACAAREILRMGEEVEAMLRPILRLYRGWDDALAETIAARESTVDRMHFAIKLYLARIGAGHGAGAGLARGMELAALAHEIESAGDAISRGMLGLARRMSEEQLSFSERGWQEIADFHDRVLTNAQRALNVLMTLSPDDARALVAEKERVREVERALQRAHLERLQEGQAQSVETSNIHQETLRSLKQVNTAFSMVAYPILEESGELLSSRLAGRAAG
ncbi:MAG: Na/Pi cotransporter family protein [Rhodobacteraceae bacterium]|nr:Na/Pi cotransporter family protein [Paracoccaceae bacterium]